MNLTVRNTLLVYHCKTKLSSDVYIILANMNSCTAKHSSFANYSSAATDFIPASSACSSPENGRVKELLNSIHVCLNYHKETAWVFFLSHGVYTYTIKLVRRPAKQSRRQRNWQRL